MRLLNHSWRVILGLFVFTSIHLQLATSELGPESAQNGKCTREDNHCYETTSGGLYSEQTNKQHSSNDDRDSQSDSENTYEVAEVSDDKPGFFSSVYNVASSGLSTVYRSAKTAKDNVYDKAANMTSDFADTVRNVLHQEVYSLLETMYTSLGKAFNTPGAVLYGLGQTAMSVTLFLLCLLLNYIFLRYCSLTFILVFDASVFLLHHFLGPKLMFDYIFWFGTYSAYLLWYMTSYPKITAFFIVSAFAYKLVMPIIKWSTGNTETQRRERLFIAVMDMNTRMADLEDNQREMLKILRNLERQRTEQNDVSDVSLS